MVIVIKVWNNDTGIEEQASMAQEVKMKEAERCMWVETKWKGINAAESNWFAGSATGKLFAHLFFFFSFFFCGVKTTARTNE